jgi:serine/threonine protein kinase
MNEKESYFDNQYSPNQDIKHVKTRKLVLSVEKLYGDNSGHAFIVVEELFPYAIFPKSKSDQLQQFFDNLNALSLPSTIQESIIPPEIEDDTDNIQLTRLLPYLDSCLTDSIQLSLPDCLNCQKLDGQTIQSFIKQILQALLPLHDKSIIHGNIKPNNIRFDQQNNIVLTDMDIPGFSNKAGFRNADVEEMAALLWTAPEQLNAKATDDKTDIWSLGVILFQMIQGEHPFAGDTPEDVLVAVTSDYDNMKTLDNVPDDIRRLVEKCLYKLPSKRFKSIRALQNELEKCAFTRKCANGHINNFDATICEQCDTPLLDVATEDKVKINNVHLTRFEGQIPPQKERLVDIEIYPLKFLTSNGGRLSIHFQDLKNPVVIPLFQPPAFELQPARFDNIEVADNESSKTFECELVLIDGEAIIEDVSILLEEQPDAITQTIIQKNSWLSTQNKERSNRLPVQFTVDVKQVVKEKEYQLKAEITVTNRNEPITLSSFTKYNQNEMIFKISDPPELFIHLQQDELIPVQKSSTLKGTIAVSNIGGGSIRLKKVLPSLMNPNSQIRLEKIFSFEELPELITIDKQMGMTEIKYEIDTRFIEDDVSQIPVQIYIDYDAIKDGHVLESSKIITVIIKLTERKEGQVFALDFGTTNSYWACNTVDEKVESGDHRSKDLMIDKEGCIPSYIQYPLKNGQNIHTGEKARIAYLNGKKNTYHSFKMKIGSNHTEPVVTDSKYDDIDAETMTSDYIQRLFEHAKGCVQCDFEEYVFTHPTRIPLRKYQAYKHLIEEQLGIDSSTYTFIDEATAAAYEFIQDNPGQYYLLIYDFGGGTTDIAFLYVNHAEDFGLQIECIDTDGLPNFGGNNITEMIKQELIQKIQTKYNILLPDPDQVRGPIQKLPI